jgi:hypothetical protein
MERRKREEINPIWFTIHVCMGISQGNSLRSYLKQKCHFFSFTKSEKGIAEQILSGGLGTSERREKVEKGLGKVNMV